MTETQWDNLAGKLGDYAFSIASLANAWAIRVPIDLLKQAASHGHICSGCISGYAMSKTLYMYYPLIVDFFNRISNRIDKLYDNWRARRIR